MSANAGHPSSFGHSSAVAGQHGAQVAIPPVCVHSLFERQVAATPGAVAVIHNDRRLTYAELDDAASRIAAHLRALGCAPGTPVAIRLGRSPELIAAMLGVMKAGAPYLPIDPADPDERVRHILDSAGAGIILADGALAVQPSEAAVIVPVDVALTGASSGVGPAGAPSAMPDDLAYVLYTSGSTGRPKGVEMAHRSLVNLLCWHDRVRPHSCALRTLQFCAVSFDFSFHEIFSTVCFGGTLVLVDEPVRRNPFALAAHIAEHGIERLFLPVTPLLQLAEAVEQRPLPLPVKEVICTGERLRITPAMVTLFRQTGARLHNHYGATEFQDATVQSLEGDPGDWPALVPAGRPIDNVSVHVLDGALAPVPPGVDGDLYIGGAGLARGYRHAADLTEQRFIPNPFGAGRLYRTGDIARFLPDGVLDHRGRADTQVKIRGVRVELTEIEVALSSHPWVSEAVVQDHEVQGHRFLEAHVVLRDDGHRAAAPDALRRHLARLLPPAMLPEAFSIMEALPLTSSGKVDRRRLSPSAAVTGGPAGRLPRTQMEQILVDVWREVLRRDTIGIDDNLFDMGATSVLLVTAYRMLADRLGGDISVVDLFRFPTIRALADNLAGSAARGAAAVLPAHSDVDQSGKADQSGDIAIIGVGCRFPGADDPDAFWRNLHDGIEAVTPLSDAELEQANPALRNQAGYVRSGAFLSDIESFDAAFFGISAKDAALMDPQHRIFLTCAWEAFENAGYAPGADTRPVGVYAGASISTYLLNVVAPHFGFTAGNPIIEADMLQFQVKLGNDRNYLPARVSYKLDLTGPSVAIQTACSTSLVAVHLACGALRAGECAMALAGGVSIIVPQRGGYLYEDGMIRSPDGHCRAFDADAAGTFFASGCGVVLLKRLDQAIADGDTVLAVVKGSAVNNDGADKVGFVAPSLDRQAEVIGAALAAAGVDPAGVGYVEAHGTGTSLGDPIEIAALNRAFATGAGQPLPRRRCAVGSVKTNIGHLDEAAGIAGLIKTAMALRHGTIPPSLHFRQPNPRIDFDGGPFYVPTARSGWPNGDGPRRAGVSSFGMGGTNCHVVMEEPPPVPAAGHPPSAGSHLLVLSARSDAALADLARGYAAWLDRRPDAPVADVCFTAAVGRRHFEHRLAIIADTAAEFRTRLAAAAGTASLRPPPASPGRVAFVFGGQKARLDGTGRVLYDSEPVFRDAIDRCDAVLRQRLGWSLLPLLFPADSGDERLEETRFVQPALFATQVALVALWRSWGVVPDVVAGHSAGELAAACAAGILTLEDGVMLAAERGRLMHDLMSDSGRMASLGADAATVADLLETHGAAVAVAAVNAAGSTVVSGPATAVDAVCAAAAARGIAVQPLPGRHAFHTPAVRPVLAGLDAAARAIDHAPPRIPLVSGLTGGLAAADTVQPGYWAEHALQPVRFADAIDALAAFGATVFVEISPQPALLPLVRQHRPDAPDLLIPSLRPGRERAQMLRALQSLYSAGAAIDWAGVWWRPGRRLALPTYPWRRERHWLEGARPASVSAPPPAGGEEGAHPLLGQPLDIAGSDDRRFQSVVGPGTLSWLGDHRVFQSVVMPGVAYVETIFAAAGPALELRDILIHRAMDFPAPDTMRVLQTELTPDGAGGYGVRIHSRLPGAPWMLHVAGRLAPVGDENPPEALDLASLCADASGTIPVEAIYQGERERSIDLGPLFHATERVWRTGTACLSRIRLPRALDAESASYRIHPVVLEAGFLALTLTYPERCGHRTYVPVGAGRVRLWTPGVLPSWCLARLWPTEEEAPETLRGDIRLLGDDGRTILSMDAVLLKRSDQRSMIGDLRAVWRPWLYRMGWAAAARPEPAAAPRRWLILADEPLGSALVVAARARGIDGMAVASASVGPETIRSLLDAAPDADVVFAAADLSHFRGPDDAALAHGTRLLAVVQALAAAGRSQALHFVTRGAQPVAATPVRDPAQTALWGMAGTVALEHPELGCRRIDLDPDAPADAQADALAAELVAGTEDQVGLRRGVRYAARLERWDITPAGGQARTDARAGTYLISGGFGGLGLEVARLLLAKGIRHLVLMGRHPPKPAAAAVVAELEAAGAVVVAVEADVADRDQVAGVIARIAQTSDLPPLRGIVHLAGVLDDGVVRLQSDARLARVMAPKVMGAWHLHELSAGLDLDAFVLFSSTAAVLGAGGQAGYAAANAFLDGLAGHRRGLGLPALSIQWGSWAEVGMSARLTLDARLEQNGEGVIPRSAGLETLAALMEVPPAAGVVAVLPVDWPRFLGRAVVVPPFLAGFLPKVERGDQAAAFRDTLAAALPERRSALLFDWLAGHLATVLGRDADVDPDAGFFSLGLDSLGAIELRNRLQAGLSRPLAQTLAFDYPSLNSLAAHLAEIVGGVPAAAGPPSAGAADPQTDDIARRLARKLGITESAGE